MAKQPRKQPRTTSVSLVDLATEALNEADAKLAALNALKKSIPEELVVVKELKEKLDTLSGQISDRMDILKTISDNPIADSIDKAVEKSEEAKNAGTTDAVEQRVVHAVGDSDALLKRFNATARTAAGKYEKLEKVLKDLQEASAKAGEKIQELTEADAMLNPPQPKKPKAINLSWLVPSVAATILAIGLIQKIPDNSSDHAVMTGDDVSAHETVISSSSPVFGFYTVAQLEDYIKAGCNFDADIRDQNGQTEAMHIIVNLGTEGMKFFVENGGTFSPDAQNVKGGSEAMAVALGGDVEALRLFVENGGAFNAAYENSYGQTEAMFVIQNMGDDGYSIFKAHGGQDNDSAVTLDGKTEKMFRDNFLTRQDAKLQYQGMKPIQRFAIA